MGLARVLKGASRAASLGLVGFPRGYGCLRSAVSDIQHTPDWHGVKASRAFPLHFDRHLCGSRP
jgi:hypothetical protein